MKRRTSSVHQKPGMTERRIRVLELITPNPKPSKAYDLFFWLQTDFPRITPATVYRTLAWLEDHGLVKKIETMLAYVGSDPGPGPGTSHSSVVPATVLPASKMLHWHNV